MISPRTRRNLSTEFARSIMAKIGVALFVLIIFGAIFAPFLAPHDPTEQDLGNGHLPPLGFSGEVNETTTQMENGTLETVTVTKQVNATVEHPLGTDPMGRDMLSRTLFGARTSLLVGFLGTAIAVGIGSTIGLTAGYYRGRVDDVLMRATDIMLAFPALVFAITLIGLFGAVAIRIPDPWAIIGLTPDMPQRFVLPGTITIVIGFVTWVLFARIARGEALAVTNEEYVKASRAAGASDRYTIRKHVLPNSLTPILVLATIQVGAVILIESALSFLGFSGTNLAWGYDIAQGRDHLARSWWISTVPGIAIMLTVISVNLLGDWLRDALDPDLQREGGQL